MHPLTGVGAFQQTSMVTPVAFQQTVTGQSVGTPWWVVPATVVGTFGILVAGTYFWTHRSRRR